MITDSALAKRLDAELTKAIEDKKNDLILTTTERKAGEIQGLTSALELLHQLYDESPSQRRQQQ